MKSWMEEISTMSGMNLAELRDAVKDWDWWRKLTMTIARALRADGTRWQGMDIGLLHVQCIEVCS